MIHIPAGVEHLRDDRVNKQWAVEVDAFLLASVPVTNEQYYTVMQKTVPSVVHPHAPVAEVSWLDAAHFCNLLSQQEGLRECYVVRIFGEGAIELRQVFDGPELTENPDLIAKEAELRKLSESRKQV